jgi:hypothetical protein
MHFFENCKLTVHRRWLYLASALMWGIVGVMLTRLAYTWLAPEIVGHAVPLALAGNAAGMVIYRFGFSKLADKNIRRIGGLDTHKCFLAFQSARSYVLIVFMMGLGITLRRSPLPKPYLAVLYAGIGIGLFLSSLEYYRHVLDA